MQVSVSQSAPVSPNTLSRPFLVRKNALPVLLLLLLLAWALRLYHLDTMSLWWDEALSWDRATNSLPAILSNTIQIQTIATRDLHPPLYFVFLHFLVLLAGTTEFALRFLSLGANLLTLAMLLPLSRLLFGKRGTEVGLLAVLFAALSPFYVWYAQEARPYALVLLTSVFSVYALLRWLKTKPRTWRDTVSRWSILFALAFAATLATHYLSFVLLPFFAATILVFGDRKRAWRARIFAPLTLLAAGMFIAFGVVLFLMPRETDMTSWDQVGPRFVPLFIMLRDVWNSFAVGLTVTLDQAGWLDLFLLALWLIGLFALVRVRSRDARLALFLLAWLFLPALALQLGSYLRPLYLNSRHLITTSPAFYLGLAVGVQALARRIPSLWTSGSSSRGHLGTSPSVLSPQSSVLFAALIGFLLAALFVGGMLYSLNHLYFDQAFAKDDHKAWAQFLRERLRADDYLLLVAPQAEKVVEYYAPPGLEWESLPHLGQTRAAQEILDRQAVLTAYRNHPRVWLLELHQPVADPTFHITDLLRRWGSATEDISFRGISTEIRLRSFVYHQLPQEPPAPLADAARIDFRHNLYLVGYNAPPAVEAGSRAVMDLYWRLARKTADNVNVSLRVVDEQGAVWGQWDAPPVGTLQPLSLWDAGKTYRDQHDLVVDAGAPPGRYFVEISMYSIPANDRWAAYRDYTKVETPLRLAEITVTRPSPPRAPATLVMDAHADVAFAQHVRFIGYDLEDKSASPGSDMPLTLYFQLLQAGGQTLNGQVALAAPWWQFWNPTRAAAPFTLDLANREAGDIVETRVNLRVPGDVSAGAYTLQLALDNLRPEALLSGSALVFADVRIDSLARSTDLPPISHPYAARFADSIELLGYDLAAPQPLKPHDQVRLTLYWRALKPMSTSYTVFTHLINRENKIYGQRDKLPLDGARQTTSWSPGEIFTDNYEFEVADAAPSGAYQIEIGLYNGADFVRLPAFDAGGSPAGDRILIGDLLLQ